MNLTGNLLADHWDAEYITVSPVGLEEMNHGTEE